MDWAEDGPAIGFIFAVGGSILTFSTGPELVDGLEPCEHTIQCIILSMLSQKMCYIKQNLIFQLYLFLWISLILYWLVKTNKQELVLGVHNNGEFAE